MSAAIYVERGPRGKWRSLPEPDYLRLLAEQGGGCAICGATPKTRRLHTDHDHKTGRVRGLLCHRCNRALPAWVSADWLVRAAEYLGGSPRAEAGKLRAAAEWEIARQMWARRHLSELHRERMRLMGHTDECKRAREGWAANYRHLSELHRERMVAQEIGRQVLAEARAAVLAERET